MVKKKAKSNPVKSVKKTTVKQKQNNQLVWAIVLMACVLLIVVFVPLIKYQFINKFVYAELEFQKTQADDLLFYSTRIPVSDAFNTKIIGTFFINFRNDPRKLKDVETDIKTGIPTFNKKEVVYISTGEMTRNCAEGTAAVLTLSGFLKQFALMNVSGAISDEKIAIENNFPYIDCENSKLNTVINLIEGNETKITQVNSNCYTLEFKDCEVMKVSEKFILEIIEGYMSDFQRKEKWWEIF
jgi:hypothetical protein